MKCIKAGLMAACLALVAGGMSARAEDKPAEPSLAQYLQQLQIKLDHAARRANQPSSEGSSVVGLRGSKQESTSKQLYWKGKKGKSAVTTDEVMAFRAAVEEARAGRKQEAVLALKGFQEKYPKSALMPDVQEALTRLNAAPQP